MRANRNKVDSANTTQILSRFLMPAKTLGSNLGLAGIFAESKQLSKEGIFASKMAIRATCGRIMATKKGGKKLLSWGSSTFASCLQGVCDGLDPLKPRTWVFMVL